MPIEALVLVLLSAFVHPIRDLLLKGHARPESAYLAVTAAWVGIAAIHVVATGASFALPAGTWPFVVISAGSLTTYYYGTMAALRTGDLSIYYPIIRSSPLLIAVFYWVIWRESYAWTTLAGIALIVIAGFAIQRQPGRLFAHPKAIASAILAMAGSAGYTIADHHAMASAAAAPFLFWVYLMVAPLMAIATWVLRPGDVAARHHLFASATATPLRIVAAALLSYTSYTFILAAFHIGAGAAETAAVRQASIPVSVVLAAVVLGETRFLHRLSWALLIAGGIVLVVVSH